MDLCDARSLRRGSTNGALQVVECFRVEEEESNAAAGCKSGMLEWWNGVD